MTTQVSPGVNVSEIDRSATTPPVSTSDAAFVGNFRWGPVEKRTLIDNESQLISVFAKPNSANTVDFHTAAYFLKYSGNLQVVRAATAAARTANSGGATDLVVKNDEDYEDQTFTFANEGQFLARYPGALGNSLKVSVLGFKTDASTTNTNFGNWAYASSFDGAPGTSVTAAANGSSNDEIHIAVVDEDGLISGTVGKILEVFSFLSQAKDARGPQGDTLYFADVINRDSKFIRFGDHDDTNFSNAGALTTSAVDFAVAPSTGVITVSLTAGVDSAALGATEFATGWDFFNDSDLADVSLLIAPDLPDANKTAIANDIISIADARKDAVVLVSPSALDNTAEKIATFVKTLTASEYRVFDTGRLRVYDRYNDTYINIPACSSTAGIIAETDRVGGPWLSPAGTRRGQYRGVTRLFFNPSKSERDLLYKLGANPVVTFPGEGTILFGDKTGSARPSAFDRINVRRLFIYLRKTIGRAARSFLFEQNNEFTRAQFKNLVEPVIRRIQGQGGIESFRVVCDETNNTPDVIDQNEFIGDIYVAPSRSINFIQLNFVATRTGVDFNELVGGNG